MESFLRDCIQASPFCGKVYAVGGYVRDRVLGIESDDIDLVIEVEGGAERLAKWLHDFAPDRISKAHAMGNGYPIWQVLVDGKDVEIADTQVEMFPDPASRQRVSRFGSLHDDCMRRDFTVNMLYLDLNSNQVIDPSGRGQSDIKGKILRGHPQVSMEKIFADDPLRILRLIRFHCRFLWSVPDSVEAAARHVISRLAILSTERIHGELEKILQTGKLAEALKMIQRLCGLGELFPELVPMIGCEQDKVYHSEGDVWVHTLRVIELAPKSPVLQLAALLHDIGKPGTRTERGERVKFIGHEKLSVERAQIFLKRLHFESSICKKVLHLVELHLRGGDALQWSTLKPARKLIRDAGDDLDDLLLLIEADSKASLGPDGQPRIEHLNVLRKKLREAQIIPVRREPLLSGRDIMSLLGLKPGPQIKQWLDWLVELEDVWAGSARVLTREDAAQEILKHASGPKKP